METEKNKLRAWYKSLFRQKNLSESDKNANQTCQNICDNPRCKNNDCPNRHLDKLVAPQNIRTCIACSKRFIVEQDEEPSTNESMPPQELNTEKQINVADNYVSNNVNMTSITGVQLVDKICQSSKEQTSQTRPNKDKSFQIICQSNKEELEELERKRIYSLAVITEQTSIIQTPSEGKNYMELSNEAEIKQRTSKLNEIPLVKLNEKLETSKSFTILNKIETNKSMELSNNTKTEQNSSKLIKISNLELGENNTDISPNKHELNHSEEINHTHIKQNSNALVKDEFKSEELNKNKVDVTKSEKFIEDSALSQNQIPTVTEADESNLDSKEFNRIETVNFTAKIETSKLKELMTELEMNQNSIPVINESDEYKLNIEELNKIETIGSFSEVEAMRLNEFVNELGMKQKQSSKISGICEDESITEQLNRGEIIKTSKINELINETEPTANMSQSVEMNL